MINTVQKLFLLVFFVGVIIFVGFDLVFAAPRFLTLPFSQNLNVLQGWKYAPGSCVNPGPDPCKHEAIDYDTGVNRPILASADGVARTYSQYQNNYGYGEYVFISHSNGYFTLYAHLNSVSSNIIYTNNPNTSLWTSVRRGGRVGLSGNSGIGNSPAHLHFEARLDNYSTPDRRDPYNIYPINPNPINIYYPPNGSSFSGCGPDYFWTVCPPVTPPPFYTPVTGTISQNTTWTNANSPYVVRGGVTVSPGVTLTVEPGTIIKFDSSASISMSASSTLNATGLLRAKIYFTSFKDDSIGGDTNGDGNATSPAPGDYYGFYFNAGSTGSFDNVVIKYGGNYDCCWNNYYGAIKVLGGNVSVKNSELSKNSSQAVYVTGGSLFIDSSVAKDNVGYGIYANVSNVTSVTVTNTSFSDNTRYDAYLNGPIDFVNSGNIYTGTSTSRGFYINGDLSADQIWNSGIPFVAQSVNLTTGKSLTIKPGVIVKFYANGLIYLNGTSTLNAISTSQNKIHFTSIKDDSIGGDTNGDGNATSPAPGDYYGFYFNAGSTGSFDNVVIKYGGNYDCCWNNYYGAIKVLGGNVSVRNTRIANNTPYGIYRDSGAINVSYSAIYNNTSYGVYNIQSPSINAQNNYWGDPSGPYHPTQNPSGRGDRVSDNVNFRPWLLADPTVGQVGPCPGC